MILQFTVIALLCALHFDVGRSQSASSTDFASRFASSDGIARLPSDKLTVIPLLQRPGLGDPGFGAYQSGLISLFGFSEPVLARIIRIFALAAYEAWAPYDSKASGLIFGKKFKRNREEQSNIRFKQTSIFYSIYRALSTLYPTTYSTFFNITRDVGLDPNDVSTNTSTPVGLGNYIGLAVVEKFKNDEFNQAGNLNSKGSTKHNRVRWLDYTRYKPVNTAYRLKDPTRWQPQLVTDGRGSFWTTAVPQPFWGLPNLTTTFAVKDPSSFGVPPPYASQTFQSPSYISQADTIIAYSSRLNDSAKMLAEYFHSPSQVLAFTVNYLVNKYGWGLDDLVKFNFLLAYGLYDADSVVWYYKRLYDSIRPESVIRFSKIYKKIVAWGGPGQGAVRMKASNWRPYLVNRISAEYPSGGACNCALFAEAARRYTGSDEFGYEAVSMPGVSYVEPGLTPNQTIRRVFKTFTDFANLCAESRVIGGIHFPDAVVQGKNVCSRAMSLVYDKATKFFSGEME